MGTLWSNPNDYSEDSSYTEDEEIVDSSVHPTYIQELKCRKPPGIGDTTDICLDSATDAFDATISRKQSLSLDQVLWIESHLDVYEKISLTYLLFNDSQIALEELMNLITDNSSRVLHKWAVNQNIHSEEWRQKFIEAVCIIQNYQVLRALHLERRDLDERFLPHHAFTGLYVSRVKKALYFACEALTSTEVENLLKLVYNDFERKNLNFRQFNKSYLELYLLYWEVIGYIKQDNLNNLYCSLKQIEKYDICDSLKQVIPQVVEKPPDVSSGQKSNKTQAKGKTTDASDTKNQNKKAAEVFNNILNCRSSLVEVVSLESNVSADDAGYVSADNKYYIDPTNPGMCLIINQESFYSDIDKKIKHLLPPHENKLESRLGTEKDKKSLEETFKLFGFTTKVVNNLTHTDIMETIEKFLQDVTNESSLFVCIMSHGDEGVIYGVNSCRVQVKSIQKLMCSKNRDNLGGKPKILILQSCQGTRCQKITTVEELDDIETDGPSLTPKEIVPPMADLFTFWATVPGYGAIRNKRTGSWFIQSLCEKMKNLGHAWHFEDICTDVIRDVSSKTWMQERGEVAMVPMKDSTLRKLFYLPLSHS